MKKILMIALFAVFGCSNDSEIETTPTGYYYFFETFRIETFYQNPADGSFSLKYPNEKLVKKSDGIYYVNGGKVINYVQSSTLISSQKTFIPGDFLHDEIRNRVYKIEPDVSGVTTTYITYPYGVIPTRK